MAVLCLAVFGAVAARTGFGYHLFWVTVPLGGISMLLALWRSSVEEPRLEEQTALTPFASVAQLLSLRRRVRSFVKARYPARLASRRIRSPVSAALIWLRSRVAWLLHSPLALAGQVLPEFEKRWNVATRNVSPRSPI